MIALTWKIAHIIGHPDGDFWTVLSADHFDTCAGALDTVSAAAALMRGALPAGGLVADYLFCEALEQAALAAEIEVMQAEAEHLKCSTLSNAVLVSQARIKAARHRYVSTSMASLEKIADLAFAPAEDLYGVAREVMQGEPGDVSAALVISLETGHDG